LPYALPVSNQRVLVRAGDVGVHDVQAGDAAYAFAASALNREESDLTTCVTGRWGSWLDDGASAPAYQGLAWLLLLVALAVLTVHLWLATRGAA
jgi:hypothetical protein